MGCVTCLNAWWVKVQVFIAKCSEVKVIVNRNISSKVQKSFEELKHGAGFMRSECCAGL